MILPPLTRIPSDVAAVADYEPLARARMSEAAWAYFCGGSADESTLRDNCAAFARIRLQNRVLADVAGGDTALELFGSRYPHPVFVAPVAFQKLAHPEGEHATALGASALQAAMVLSTQSSTPLEAVAQTAQAPLWFQLYIQPDRDFTRALVQRAEAAGYRALVVTVDAPINALRNREQRAGFALPPGIEAVNLRGMRALPPQSARAGDSLLASALLAAAPTWNDVDWLRAQTRLPILLKGITAPQDAQRALDHGVSGLIVSNHGGRTLDTLPASIDALPAIARAVKGRVPLLLDGGIRRGSDVFKALALGASAVLVGRPIIHALAAAGAPGVAHVLHLLRTELEVTMALCGCRTLAQINAAALWQADA
ncbi:alpha-hydroxy acid oxidase [Sinimarinibacterium sp. NLF-5-8]|uniref:alpha-hydroxy acid oxidase n=1 Tax=Sinimarinibacterium sp. NLF-5-8 TaxID=2698684 RepID=UPI00137C3B2E|nr:alpha-hydroxy acid oxidase [Sinimarinibacterium sp. NLF-5-8]QHS10674.1 alpha-hydroxy-acid oxidizing protein [Sinimarinibacterium sp. NLF-5-8]